MLKAFIFGACRDAIVRGRAVKLWKIEQWALAVVKSPGKHQAEAAVLPTVSRAPLIRAEAAIGKGNFKPLDLSRFSRDYVDHRKKRVRSIQRRTGPANDFQALDQVHIDQELRPQKRLSKNVVVDAMAVDEH